MKFENISTEEDFRLGQIRMAVLWEKEDVGRFSEFFERDMVDVVQIISDDGPVATLISPQIAEPVPADVMISANALKAKLQYEYNRADEEGEVEAVCAYMHAHHIIEELETEARNG